MCDLDGPLEMLDVHAACFCDLVVDLHALANIFNARDAQDNPGEGGETMPLDAEGDVDVVPVQPDPVALDNPGWVHDRYSVFQCALP